MDNYSTFCLILIISSVWIVSCEAQLSTKSTPAAPSCTKNGRFADPSDPCNQAYIVCLWTGSSFLKWALKCPNNLIFNEITSMCVRSTTPLPAICGPTTTTATPDDTTIASPPATPSCVMNGRFADPSDPCGQTYILCSWDGTQFLSWTLKCPNNLVFFQVTSECVAPKTTLPPSCENLVTTAAPSITTIPTTAASATTIPTTAAPITTIPTTAAPVTTITTTAVPVTTIPTTAAPITTISSTAAPVTTIPTTAAPITTIPTTAAPVTTIPTTAAPVTTIVAATTTAAPFCTMNGRFADPSDPCGQAYIMCSWDGTKFIMWKLKCPNKLVFYQITAKCVRPTAPLPSTC